MKAYTQNPMRKTQINQNEAYKGETIEQKVRRIMTNNEPITDGAPLIYTDRKDGVDPGHNIRTDRFDLAVEAMDHVTKTNVTKRMDNIAERTYNQMDETQKAKYRADNPKSRQAEQYNEANPQKGTA